MSENDFKKLIAVLPNLFCGVLLAVVAILVILAITLL